MKNLIRKISYAICIVLAAGFLSACSKFKNTYIEQEVRIDVFSGKIKFTTYVWHNNRIMETWNVPIGKADSAMIHNRYEQARQLIDKIKKAEKHAKACR